MAGVVEPAFLLSLSKHVQQMSTDGDDPPPSYLVKDGTGITNPSPPLVPIPVIDLSLLSSSALLSSKGGVDELEKLKLALSSWGCFQVYFLLQFLQNFIPRNGCLDHS